MYASSVNAQFSVNLIKLMVEDKICSVNFYDKLSIEICIAFFLELVPDIRLLNKKHGFKNNLHMYGCVRIFFFSSYQYTSTEFGTNFEWN